jgi:hypothetical protein
MATLTFSHSPNQELFADPLTEGLAQRRAGASRASCRGRSAKCKEDCTNEMHRWRPGPVVSDPSRTWPAWPHSPLPNLGRFKSARDPLSIHHVCSGLWVGNVN